MSGEQQPSDFQGNERFAVVRRIGAGGMGVVYEALDRERGMRVALKTLQAVDANRLHRFKQEFRNITDLIHPNLVVLYELLSDGETWFLTMELVDGVDFLQHVYRGPEAEVEDVSVSAATSIHHDTSSGSDESSPPTRSDRKLRVISTPEQYARLRTALRSLAEGVNALHQAGRIHRDIKPSNVLVSHEHRVVILDFGLSTIFQRNVGQHLEENRVSGTISYMSPEQMSVDRDPTPASDWYAVGTMLYQTLTGRLPFSGKPGTVMAKKRSSDPLPPGNLVDEVPEDLETLCMEMLRRDPAARPSGSEILERLGGTRSISMTHLGEGPLMGREAQLELLSRGLAVTRSRRTAVAFVHGSSGAGKTFLVNRFLSSVERDPNTAIFLGRCYEAETVPYKTLDSLVDSIARFLARSPLGAELVPRDVQALTRLFPVLRQIRSFHEASPSSPEIPDRQELRRRAVGALREILTGLADRMTLVLCIDDLQWGDLDSANLLAELLRPPASPRLFLLCVYRSEYATSSESLRMLLETSLAGEEGERFDVPVDSLTLDDSRRLALTLLGGAGEGRDSRAAAIAEESAGVPYFIHELVRYALERPALEVDDDSKAVSLDDVLAKRFAALPPSSRRLLEVISVVGRPLQRGDAFAAANLEPEERAAFAHLRGISMIRSTGWRDDDMVEVYHDRMRETLVGQLSPNRVETLYSRLAATLESSGGYDPETVAICFRGSGQLDRAGEYYELGAIEATEALAFDRAANLYRQAIDLRPGLPIEQQSDLYEKLGEALANAGRTAEAARIYERAMRGATPARAVELQRLSAYHFCSSGRLEEGRAALDRLLATQGLSLPRSQAATIARLLWNRLRLWHRFRQWQRNPELAETTEKELSAEVLMRIDVTWSASAGLSMMDIIAGAAFQAQNLILALQAGEPYRIARAMAWEAAHTSNGGSDTWPRTLELLDAARRLADRVDHPHAVAMVTMARGIAEFTMGRWVDSIPLLSEAERIFRERCTGVTWELDTASTFRLWALVYQGEFPEMASRTNRLIKEANERGDLYATTNLESFMLPHALLANDDPAGARHAVHSSQSRWSREGFQLQDLTAVMSSTLIELYEGRGVSAWETIDGNWKSIERAQLLRLQILRIFLRHFRARSALEAVVSGSGASRLISTAEREAARISREGVPWARPIARSLEAAIASHRGSREKAADLFIQVERDFHDAAMWSYAASARRRRGELLADISLIDSADELMRARGVKAPEKMTRMHLAGVRL